MMNILAFAGVTGILILEGATVSYFFVRQARMSLALSLPIAAFINLLVVFVWTVANVPLTTLTLLTPQVLLGIILLFAARVVTMPEFCLDPSKSLPTRTEKVVTVFACILIFMNILYSFSHAVLLPSAQYDSATNWTMRSEISFYDHKVAFDASEVRGMAKPQYPFLFHALQITANQGQGEWNDAAANTILFLLSIATFTALYLILRRFCSIAQAAVTIALILGIPLMGMHVAQGYGDITLAQFFLLSLACFAVWKEPSSERRLPWLILSGLFASASVWTKSEGLLFGLIPWLVLIGWSALGNFEMRKQTFLASGIAIVFAIPWPIFATLKKLSLTPHGTDTTIQFHPEGLQDAFLGLFSRGSFGIYWYVLPITIAIILHAAWKKDLSVRRALVPLLLWGGILFLEVLFVYLFTPNVRFLLNAESYYRQMMIPAAMLLLACSFCLRFKSEEGAG